MTPDDPSLRYLDPNAIAETVRQLQLRIRERFPDASLNRVAQELRNAAELLADREARIQRHNLALRACSVALTLLGAVTLFKIATYVRFTDQIFNASDFVQSAQAGIETVFFLGAGIAFLFGFENRLRRDRALDYIHEMRSLAHIVDMHQLTKDPEILVFQGPSTPSSPRRTMTPFELSRYFDYCSELLSLISKVATFYVQEFRDPVALAAVDQVEDLTTGLSQKIWQKTAILDRFSASALARPQGGP